jgi:pyruvate kinase
MSHSAQAGESLRTSELQLVNELIRELDRIYKRLEALSDPGITSVHPAWRKSALNLLHYLELRRHDIRPLQLKLAKLGLSSLGRAEAHVMATLRAVVRTLHYLDGREPAGLGFAEGVEFSEGSALLEGHTDALLGPPPAHRAVRIMVTMPEEAATDPSLVRSLLKAGMDCMRINCAHDDPRTWEKMIGYLRKAEREVGRKCRVLMDLAGPKLRTGAINSLPVVKCRPVRDEMGRVTAPSRIWFFPVGHPGPFPKSDAQIPVAAEFLNQSESGDFIRFTDCRGAVRRLRITGVAGPCRWAEGVRTFYLTPGIQLRLIKAHESELVATASVGEMLPAQPNILLKKGDILVVKRSPEPGQRAIIDAAGHLVQPAEVPCTLPEVFDSVKAGEHIWFDDGKIGGTIVQAGHDALRVEITQTPGAAAKLATDKGINLPDTELSLPALTTADLEILPFVASHADLVGMSFVERPEDVFELQRRLKELGKQPGIVLKIETRRAFETLPGLLLAAMHNPSAGVMIARGDLAVECGFERLAEVQEEILWICEAAHMPVIWATQVLESLAKSGQPSRSEITDAAMGERAECVMLNKGPHILDAMKSLDDILRRMQHHQRKKQTLLRQLKSWDAEKT